MKYRTYIPICFAFIFLTAFSAAHAKPKHTSLSEIFSGFEKKIRKVEFSNGLKLILMKRGFAPVVACYIKFKAGSYDENPKNFGIAHILEHMLFKGTRRVGTKDFPKEKKYLQLSIRFAEKWDYWRKRYEKASQEKNHKESELAQKEAKKWKSRLNLIQRQSRLYIIPEEDSYLYALQGARGYNAYTSSDLTNYQVQIPSNRVEVWARLESDRIQNSVLRQFYTEREVVQEERRMRIENSPRSTLREKFRMAIYQNHPYGHPIIGPMKSIRYLYYKQAMDFYQSYYVPNNIVITLVGNIDLKNAERVVRKYFAPIPPKPIPKAKEITPVQPRYLDIQHHGGKTPLLYMAWFKPPMPDPNDLYLETLSQILAGSPDTRLYRRLVVKEKLAVSVFAYNGIVGNRAVNLFLIGAEPGPGVSLDKLRSIILEELDQVRKQGIEKKELTLVKRRLRLDLINKLQDNASLADMLSYFELISSDYRNLFSYNQLLDKIRTKDIQSAALRYLKPKYTMTARLIPKEKD